MVDVSISIVLYNQKQLIERCLQSIYNGGVQRATYEVIVVDNASTDGARELVAQKYPAVHLLANAQNLGHSVACNQGLAAGGGRYRILLDSDAELYPGAVDALVEFLDVHPEAGAVGPKLLNPNLTDQGAAKTFPTPMAALFGRRSLLTRLFPNNRFSRRYLIGLHENGTEPFGVDSTSSACLMVRGEVYAQVGGLDERFFFYWNDVDWCRRIKDAGWQVWVVPRARVIHWEGNKRRTLRQQRWTIVMFHKNVYRYYCKHHAKSPLNPMRWIALIGLTLHGVLMMGISVLKETKYWLSKAGEK